MSDGAGVLITGPDGKSVIVTARDLVPEYERRPGRKGEFSPAETAASEAVDRRLALAELVLAAHQKLLDEAGALNLRLRRQSRELDEAASMRSRDEAKANAGMVSAAQAGALAARASDALPEKATGSCATGESPQVTFEAGGVHIHVQNGWVTIGGRVKIQLPAREEDVEALRRIFGGKESEDGREVRRLLELLSLNRVALSVETCGACDACHQFQAAIAAARTTGAALTALGQNDRCTGPADKRRLRPIRLVF